MKGDTSSIKTYHVLSSDQKIVIIFQNSVYWIILSEKRERIEKFDKSI